MINKINTALAKLRQTKPLVLCLTNYVTMDFMANSLLALGAAPIMSCATEEIEELIKIAQAVNINIGTLNAEFIARCEVAIKFAQRYGKPIVLDPVGAGASLLRTASARRLMVFTDIIRGNASEIMALMEDEHQTHGVESTQQVQNAKDIAFKLAKTLGCTVVVSGEEDFVTDGSRQELLKFGSPIMSRITGMGCALTAVIAAFRAVMPDPFSAAAIATAYFGLCGNLAHSKTNQPGTFRAAFIDALEEGVKSLQSTMNVIAVE